jgi:uncharacterized protein YbjT (DUF2867 family)
LVQRAIIIGGSGFVGQELIQHLSTAGIDTTLTTRSTQKVRSLENKNPLVKPIHVKEFTPQVLRELLQNLTTNDIVMNLVGVLHSRQGVPFGPEFQAAHVDIPQMIISVMKEYGLKRYLHMSSLGADVNGPSMYLRSKGFAEEMVKQSDLDWTIFRPSVIFGKNDNFINMFGKMQKFFPLMPLAGANNLFQPVAVDDVASAFVKSIHMTQTIHQSYDLGGPEVLSLRQIIQFAAQKVGVKRPVIPLPSWVGYMQAFLFENLPGPTIMSRDNVDSMKTPSVLGNPEFNALQEVFQITPQPLQSLLN